MKTTTRVLSIDDMDAIVPDGGAAEEALRRKGRPRTELVRSTLKRRGGAAWTRAIGSRRATSAATSDLARPSSRRAPAPQARAFAAGRTRFARATRQARRTRSKSVHFPRA